MVVDLALDDCRMFGPAADGAPVVLGVDPHLDFADGDVGPVPGSLVHFLRHL